MAISKKRRAIQTLRRAVPSIKGESLDSLLKKITAARILLSAGLNPHEAIVVSDNLRKHVTELEAVMSMSTKEMKDLLDRATSPE